MSAKHERLNLCQNRGAESSARRGKSVADIVVIPGFDVPRTIRGAQASPSHLWTCMAGLGLV